MQIAVTQKLAKAMGAKLEKADQAADPFYSWTASWVNTFGDRKEDMVVLINNATRFTVPIYGVRRNHFKDIAAKMTKAIRNTFLAMNINPEVIDEYFRQAGEVQFATNHDRKLAAQVARQGLESCFVVGNIILESEPALKYNDTMGRIISRHLVGYGSGSTDYFVPAEEMMKALENLTEKPLRRYRALELLVVLDLESHLAVRRIVVPADILLADLHRVLQQVFGWTNSHLHDFVVLDGVEGKKVERLVMTQLDLEYDEQAVLEEGYRLSDFFPEHSLMRYTYDFGDNWQHMVELVRVIDNHDDESPYLLDAIGKTPPEDVGGIGGFAAFQEIMRDPSHPEYEEMRQWSKYWSPGLSKRERQPGAIRGW